MLIDSEIPRLLLFLLFAHLTHWPRLAWRDTQGALKRAVTTSKLDQGRSLYLSTEPRSNHWALFVAGSVSFVDPTIVSPQSSWLSAWWKCSVSCCLNEATSLFPPGVSIPMTSQTPSTWNGTNPLATPRFSEVRTSSSPERTRK